MINGEALMVASIAPITTGFESPRYASGIAVIVAADNEAANAALIAVAPELLHQLQVCCEYIRAQWLREIDLPTLYLDSVALIAKAKGGPP